MNRLPNKPLVVIRNGVAVHSPESAVKVGFQNVYLRDVGEVFPDERGRFHSARLDNAGRRILHGGDGALIATVT